MLLNLKVELIRRSVRQTRMAVELGWDPAKLSRIVNEIVQPTPGERQAISGYLRVPEAELFGEQAARPEQCKI